MLRTKLALLSVSDKTDIHIFAERLIRLGWNIVASPGTAKVLRRNNIPVTSLEEITGISPILGHRVFSEHIKIAGALVAEDNEEHDQDRSRYDIPWFDLICVDLYPLSQAVAKATSEADVIESTDIGGVTLMRNAVKGRRIVVTDFPDRQLVIDRLELKGDVPVDVKRKLWYKAEALCADYCLQSAKYIGRDTVDGFIGLRTIDLRYGENPYQSNAAYYQTFDDPLSLHRFEELFGDSPSFVNMTSLSSLIDVLVRISLAFRNTCGGHMPLIAVGAKHGIVVGAAVDWQSEETVLRKMLWSNPKVIWGGEVITNFEISDVGAKILLSDDRREELFGSVNWMLDIIGAPGYEEGVKELLNKKGKRKIFLNPALKDPGFQLKYVYRYVRGGFLRQPIADFVPDLNEIEWTSEPLTGTELDTLFLAWAIAWSTHMNGIAIARERQLLACDGQPSSVGAAQSCIMKMKDAGHGDQKFVFAANAFLPFTDCAQIFAENGALAGLLPKGGVREKEIRRFFSERDITLAFVPEKFRGFAHH